MLRYALPIMAAWGWLDPLYAKRGLIRPRCYWLVAVQRNKPRLTRISKLLCRMLVHPNPEGVSLQVRYHTRSDSGTRRVPTIEQNTRLSDQSNVHLWINIRSLWTTRRWKSMWLGLWNWTIASHGYRSLAFLNWPVITEYYHFVSRVSSAQVELNVCLSCD